MEIKIDTDIATEYNSNKQNELIKVIDILKSVNWDKFHQMCMCIGNELNDSQWRFMKAIFLENAVAIYSDNKLTYVGDKEKGCDFRIKSLNDLKIEMKYTEECLFGGKNLTLKKITKQITLLNSRGTNTHFNLPKDYSDYLLIVEMKGAALISKEILQKYVTSHGDSLTAKIPTDELYMIFEPSDINLNSEKKNLHIKDAIMSTIIQLINNVT
jgi:hypothetical protein